jgi:hypothetical protein
MASAVEKCEAGDHLDVVDKLEVVVEFIQAMRADQGTRHAEQALLAVRTLADAISVVGIERVSMTSEVGYLIYRAKKISQGAW